MTRLLVRDGVVVVLAVLISQALAFGSFLVAMNAYRLAVNRLVGERI